MKDKIFDCIIIGGGIAGLQAAIQLGRYKHEIAVIDACDGRSSICRCYHNILGWPDGVSGLTLRKVGREQAEALGIHFSENKVVEVSKESNLFTVRCHSGDSYLAKRILLATGVKDNIPPIKNIYSCLGLSVYICPDCDGYEVVDKQVIVLGSGAAGSSMALTLLYWTKQITYIDHQANLLPDEDLFHLTAKGITYKRAKVTEVLIGKNPTTFLGVQLENNEVIYGDCGFLAFGGNVVRTELGSILGIERTENKHIMVDPRTKKTNVPNVWAAGDITVHSEQATIAMGDGMQAAIWIHKSILEEKES